MGCSFAGLAKARLLNHLCKGRQAAMTAPVLARGYAVQVTSERSAGRAQATFRALQVHFRSCKV